MSENDFTRFPYNCIGQIIGVDPFYQKVKGTGFLISSSLVLTCAHNFEGLSETFEDHEFETF